MRRRPTAVGILLTTLTAIILALLPGTAADAGTRHPAKRYNPPAGVKVNNPLGTKAERRAIISHIIRAIDDGPAGHWELFRRQVRRAAVRQGDCLLTVARGDKTLDLAVYFPTPK